MFGHESMIWALQRLVSKQLDGTCRNFPGDDGQRSAFSVLICELLSAGKLVIGEGRRNHEKHHVY